MQTKIEIIQIQIQCKERWKNKYRFYVRDGGGNPATKGSKYDKQGKNRGMLTNTNTIVIKDRNTNTNSMSDI